jgi:hypothetical protein
VRENYELFRNINEFYSIIQQQQYLITLAHRERVFLHHIEHIQNIEGGRIDALQPMRTKPFTHFSMGLIFDVLEFFSIKEGFSKFRLVNKRFNASFEQHIVNITFRLEDRIKEYQPTTIEETNKEIQELLDPLRAALYQQLENIKGIKKPDKDHPCSGIILQNIMILGYVQDIYDEEATDYRKISHDAEGQPILDQGLTLDYIENYLDVNKPCLVTMKDFKRFHEFYGPNPAQYKEYLLLTKQKHDPRYEFVKKNIEFWFQDREGLKARSNIHKLLLEQEERKGETRKIVKFLKKFKPEKIPKDSDLLKEEESDKEK